MLTPRMRLPANAHQVILCAALHTAAPVDAHLVPTHYEEGGMRFRRRSRSAKELAAALRESADAVEYTRTGASLDFGASPHGSKRSSFEAGLPQNLKAATESPQQSAEKVRRQGNGGKTSDFLPDELIQRSRLFNSRSNARSSRSRE